MKYDAIIVGAGFGGLGQAATLKHKGIHNFIVLEKSHDVGGVWRDNTYPGVANDTQSVIYCYSYFLNLDVSAMYAPGAETYDYLKQFANHFELMPHVKLNSEVITAVWDEDDSSWSVTTPRERYVTKTLISACGQLGDPLTPEVQGIEYFKGEVFHASRWNHDVDLKGKNVATIGSAATAIQCIPEIAPEVEKLTVFQRSANYILPREQIHFTEEDTRTFVEDPDNFRKLRNEIHEMREAGFQRTLRDSTASEEGSSLAMQHLQREIEDPKLRAQLTPDYAYGCKRILRSDDFYPALRRDNVELVSAGIEKAVESGVVTSDGEVHDLDVIIFATGFKSQKFIGDQSIVGKNGVELSERWGDSPEAYYGIAVHGFPNLFLVYGPNTNLNHNSIVSMLEIQHEYISGLVELIVSGRTDAVEVTKQAENRIVEQIQDELSESSYSADCSSWYKNAAGRVINNWSSTVDVYRSSLATYEPEDLIGLPELSKA